MRVMRTLFLSFLFGISLLTGLLFFVFFMLPSINPQNKQNKIGVNKKGDVI